MKRLLIAFISLFCVLTSSYANTITIPSVQAIEPFAADFSQSATMYFENYNVQLSSSLIVVCASGDWDQGFQVKEISVPNEVTPIDYGSSVQWPGIFSFPSGATAVLSYGVTDLKVSKSIFFTVPAIEAIPSPTSAEFFLDCESPWFGFADIDFQLNLPVGAKLYADGNEFDINDATYANVIEVKSATGQLYFTIDQPFMLDEGGQNKTYTKLYYDGVEGILLYLFADGDWQNGVYFDPTISTSTYGYFYDTYVRSDQTSTNYSTQTSIELDPARGEIGLFQVDINSALTAAGVNPALVCISGAALNTYTLGNRANTYVELKAPTTVWNATVVTYGTKPDLGTTVLTSGTITSSSGDLTTFSSLAFAELLEGYRVAGMNEWQKGFSLSEEDAVTLITTQEYAGQKSYLTITYATQVYQSWDSAIVSNDTVILSASNYVGYVPMSFLANTYQFLIEGGTLISAGTTSYDSYSLNGTRSVASISIPVGAQEKPSILYSYNGLTYQPFEVPVYGGASASAIATEVLSDPLFPTKPMVLSMVKSVSDQVAVKHATTDAYVIAAYNKSVTLENFVTATLQVPATGVQTVDSDIIIDDQGPWIATMRGLSLSSDRPNMEAYMLANNVVLATWTPRQAAASSISYSSFEMEETIGTSPVYSHQLAYTFVTPSTGVVDWFGFVYLGSGNYQRFGKTISIASPIVPDLSSLQSSAQADIHTASLAQQIAAAQLGFAGTSIREVTMYLSTAEIARATTGLSSANSIYCPTGAIIAQDFYLVDSMGNTYEGGTLFDYYSTVRMKPIDLPSGTTASDWLTTKGWSFTDVTP